MIDPHKIGMLYKEPTYRSELKIGNLTVYNEKRFNWFNRLMMKIIFGWEVTTYKKEENQC